MWLCTFEHSWIVPEGLCLSLFLPHSLCSASIQTLNGQGFNYSPHLSDQIQLENEETPRQAQSFLCNVLHGRGHPALSSREYFPLLVAWPFWKTGTSAFAEPLVGLAHCVWPLLMLINLPDDALRLREPFIPPGLLMTNMNARKFSLLLPDLHAPLSLCFASLSPSPLACLPHDRLTAHITRSARVWHSQGGWSPQRGCTSEEQDQSLPWPIPRPLCPCLPGKCA